MQNNTHISQAMQIHLGEIFDDLPELPDFEKGIRRAPARHFTLTPKDTQLALKNALRYVPEKWHATLAPEFLDELVSRGRIYGYRFRPPGHIKGQPIDEYRATVSRAKHFR
jgi:urocanate hydratase